jgi:hypothetical protein
MSLPPSLTLPLALSDDPEITCVFCGNRKVDLEIEVFHPGKRSWSGAHQECVDHHNTYFLKRYASQTGSLADRVLSMVFAFDAGDSRRADVRSLAREVAALQQLVRAAGLTMFTAKYQLEQTRCLVNPDDDLDHAKNSDAGYNHAMVNTVVLDLTSAIRALTAAVGPEPQVMDSTDAPETPHGKPA